MTLDEIVYFQRKMADAGWSADQVAAFGQWTIERRDQLRVERKLYRAVARALVEVDAPVESVNAPIAAVVESGFTAANADSELVRSSPIKSSARAGVVTALGLRKGARLVAARLIEHYNLKTSRCDPGIRRLAEDTGLDQRSVRRSLTELENLRLIRRTVHAGRGHTNDYRVDFGAMARLAVPIGGQQKRTLESTKPDERVRQNRLRKQSLPAVGVAPPRAKPPDPRQPQLLLPIVSRPEAAAMAARRRVHADIAEARIATPGLNVSGLSDDDWAIVVDAEMRRRGEGLGMIGVLLGTGPPAAATG